MHTCISIDNQTFHCQSGKNRVSIGYVFFSVTIYLVVLKKKNNPDNFLQDFLKALSILQFLVTDVLGLCYVNTVNVTYHIIGFTWRQEGAELSGSCWSCTKTIKKKPKNKHVL